jgi:hypothetical protein
MGSHEPLPLREEHGNMMWTYWKIHVNIVRTSWERHGNIKVTTDVISAFLFQVCRILLECKFQCEDQCWTAVNFWRYHTGSSFGIIFLSIHTGQVSVLGTPLKTFILSWSGPRSILASCMADMNLILAWVWWGSYILDIISGHIPNGYVLQFEYTHISTIYIPRLYLLISWG